MAALTIWLTSTRIMQVAQAEATMPEYDPFSGKEAAPAAATTTPAKEPDWVCILEHVSGW